LTRAYYEKTFKEVNTMAVKKKAAMKAPAKKKAGKKKK